ncbi:hypothetical protein [Microlunatus sp. Y2014]|uniref:hypothetical protein n=1 Tax=Microlunatus sp. Y2014 TaxID=3418488 RepID=UPI003DA729AC
MAPLRDVRILPARLVAAAGIAVIGLLMINFAVREPEARMWIVAAVLMFATAIAQVVATRQVVEADAEGIRTRQLGNSWQLAWGDIETLQVRPAMVRCRTASGLWRICRPRNAVVDQLLTMADDRVVVQDLRLPDRR